ncbi:MAG: hypothetical protein AB7N80_13700 [Bdellovibrionales bacterium]
MKKRRQRFNEPAWVGFVLLLLLFHHTLDASQTQIFSGPVSMAMGGGGRAGIEATEKFFLNPAAVAFGEGFELGMSFRDGYWANGEHESGFNIAMLENDPENFAKGGFAYVQRRRTAPGLTWDEQYIYGAIGQNVSEFFSFGISVYHLSQKVKDAPDHTAVNGSLGALFTLNPAVGFAYVFTNPVAADKDVPVALRPIPQQSIALNVLFQQLMRITLDVTRYEKQNPDKKGIIQIGNEIKLTEYGVFRLGFEVDDIQKRNAFTAGIGFLGPRLRANYAFVKPFVETNGAMHSVDLRLPF